MNDFLMELLLTTVASAAFASVTYLTVKRIKEGDLDPVRAATCAAAFMPFLALCFIAMIVQLEDIRFLRAQEHVHIRPEVYEFPMSDNPPAGLWSGLGREEDNQ
jgi:hypothetical protein